MKILLIGAGGVASVLSKLLAKTSYVSEIICGTVNLTQSKEFIFPHPKIKLITLDASKEEDIEKAAKEVDLIINASLPDFNEIILRAALSTGTNYLDLCSFLKDGKTAEQLKFDQAFKKSKLKAIIGAGVSPGISNLLVANAADKMNEVDEVKIRTIEEQKASELIFSWSPKVTLDELTAKPLVLENSEYRSIKPFDEPELFDFPQPYSKKRVMSISCDELATIPHYVKIKNMTYKATGTDIDFGNALSRLGLFL